MYYTIPEVAKLLGMTRQAIWLRIKNKTVPALRVGRFWVIPKEELKNIGGKYGHSNTKKR